MDVEHLMGIPCHIRCETMDVEGLSVVRVRPWAPPAQYVEWVNPHNKQIIPPLGPVGRLHLCDEKLARPGVPTFNPHISAVECSLLPCVHCCHTGSGDRLFANGCQVCLRSVQRPCEYAKIWYLQWGASSW